MLTITPHIVWQDVPGELALFDSATQAYHCLDPIGSDIWRSLAAGAAIDALVDSLIDRFDAPRGEVEHDVRAFIDDALAKGLLMSVPAA